MSADGPTDGPSSPAEAVVVEGRRGISPIWLIPLVALLVAGGLAYRAIQERGPQVVILFESGEGLEAGKSKVKFRDVEIGTVDLVRIRDWKQVEVHCSLDKSARGHLTEGTKWWVVRPRVGHGAISGLGTIISGSYVTLEPGPKGGASQREFVGLEEPPLPAEDAPGLPIALHTNHLGGLDAGSPIFFRDIHVGDVRGFSFSKDGKTVDIDALIFSSHAGLVRSNSRFWNAGGVEVSVGSGGLHVKTETLKSILVGGVAFDSPGGGDPAKKGDAFWLHASDTDAHKAATTYGGLGLVLETGALGGVSAGNPVYYRQLPVGAVVSHELSKDGSTVRIRLNIERRYASLVRSNSVFWNAGGISAELGIHGLKVHTESLKALLAGGVSFATPPRPGHTVSEGSVFPLHHEAKDEWMAWETDFEPKPGDEPEKHRILGKFFHHKGKSEDEAKKDDPTPEPTEDEHKHHFLRGLLHRGG
jgi:paraquat-inducible protein B